MLGTILKFLVVAGLMIAGGFFLAKGLGVQIPVVKYRGWEAQNVPVGIALLAIGVLTARFWKVSKTIKIEETTRTISPDGSTQTETITTTTIETTSVASSDFGRDDKKL